MQYQKREGLFGEVYKIIKKIPKGKVVTYGQLAKMAGTRDARKIGWALHANRDPNCPCHRVVNKEGKLAANFAVDGPREQRRRLLDEGVKFRDEMHVDIEACLWQPLE
ncbi:methylated-DNA--[protein]-cysteine S-methyltransferase [Patescibacteria group bacterium]|nr:methylated-DNA--[protein]-cysteine S-methyltransferase [Patescibacteria group bacterium]